MALQIKANCVALGAALLVSSSFVSAEEVGKKVEPPSPVVNTEEAGTGSTTGEIVQDTRAGEGQAGGQPAVNDKPNEPAKGGEEGKGDEPAKDGEEGKADEPGKDGEESKADEPAKDGDESKADEPAKDGEDKEDDTSVDAQAEAERLKQIAATERQKSQLRVLYGAVPGAVLGLSDAMLETAMGPAARSSMMGSKEAWGRMNVAGARPVAGTGLKAPVGASNNTRLESRTFTAQFGMPVYTSDTTRLDATIGFGSRITQLAPLRKREPDLKTFSASIGANLQHRAPSDIDLRLGAQISGGSSTLKGAGTGPFGSAFEKKFNHFGLGLRAEVSRDFAVGSSVVVTPLLGAGVSTARVKERNASTSNNSAASVWMATRVAYNHAMQTGRSASVWVEPTYISQLKRSTTMSAQLDDTKFDVTSRLPRDRMGVRLGMDMPVGKQASFQASLSQFWGVGSARQKDGALQLGYTHRF